MKILLVTLLLLNLACGKIESSKSSSNSAGTGIGRVINPLTEGNFSLEEKALGSSFCDSLEFKRTNFASMYTGAFASDFTFSMNKKDCGSSVKTASTQVLRYTNSNPLNYTGTGIVPNVETDTSGVFATYCANQNQDSRAYTGSGSVKVYRFKTGDQCGGSINQICAEYEFAGADQITTQSKVFVITQNQLFSKNLKGQEVFSREIISCGGSDFRSLEVTLSSVN